MSRKPLAAARRWPLVAAVACSVATAAQACPLPSAAGGEQRIAQAGIELAWQAEAGRLAVGQPFALRVQICPASAKLLQVDATMPEHRHGMNYRPSVKPLGDARWHVEGLLWHMAGRWELAFEVDAGGERQWLRQSITLR